MWFKQSKRYFRKIENFAYGEINERSFSNPHPCTKLSKIWNEGVMNLTEAQNMSPNSENQIFICISWLKLANIHEDM